MSGVTATSLGNPSAVATPATVTVTAATATVSTVIASTIPVSSVGLMTIAAMIVRVVVVTPPIPQVVRPADAPYVMIVGPAIHKQRRTIVASVSVTRVVVTAATSVVAPVIDRVVAVVVAVIVAAREAESQDYGSEGSEETSMDHSFRG